MSVIYRFVIVADRQVYYYTNCSCNQNRTLTGYSANLTGWPCYTFFLPKTPNISSYTNCSCNKSLSLQETSIRVLCLNNKRIWLDKTLCQKTISALGSHCISSVNQTASASTTFPAVSTTPAQTLASWGTSAKTITTTTNATTTLACDNIESSVQGSISLLTRNGTLQTTEVIDHMNMIESNLWSLSTCNEQVAKREFVNSDFHMAMKVTNSSATFNVRSTYVSIDLKQRYHGLETTVYAAELGLPTDVMSLFITSNQSSPGQSASASVTQSTSLFPSAPFISVASLAVNGTSPMSRVTFTFRINASELYSSVSTIMTSSASSDRALLTHLRPSCSFLHVNGSKFSDAGCGLVTTADNTNVTCACNHTTLFAVLLTAKLITVPKGVEVLSYVTTVASMICAIITIVILFKLRRSIGSDRTVVQINLCVALAFLNLSTLLQTVAVGNDRCCEMVAVFVHYFLLATGAWMSVDALLLALKTSKKALQYANKRKVAMYRVKHLLGWVVPGIIVALSTIIGFPMGAYMKVTGITVGVSKYNFCWLSATSGIRIVAVLVPLGVSLAFNLVVAVKVSRLVAQLSEEQMNYVPADKGDVDYDHVMAGAKALIMLIPVFGITWIFAFLAGTDDKLASTVFMYFNAIVNGLQGFFLLLVYCVANIQVRAELSRELSRYRLQNN